MSRYLVATDPSFFSGLAQVYKRVHTIVMYILWKINVYFNLNEYFKGNSLIDAAKRMALLMAEMSRLVQEGGNKGEVSMIL